MLTDEAIEVFDKLKDGVWKKRTNINIKANKRILYRLTKRGYLEKQGDLLDMRCIQLRLTEKGIKTLNKLREEGYIHG